MKKTLTGIAMSGGVDSTATAILQKQEGDVRGFFMNLGQPDYQTQKEQVQDIAKRLDIELEIIDLREDFQKYVLEYFTETYFKGLTPNPCVVCNKEIKFGLFHKAILAQGVDRIATGHYARIMEKEGSLYLHKGLDPYKDQSYFLSRLEQKHLARSIFPLGAMHKSDIYDLVESHGFMDFRGKESQDVCFLEQDNVANFLEQSKSFSFKEGNITLKTGKILGKHKGLHRYTVGQRKGLGISHPKPLYVLALNKQNNTVIVGENEELFQQNVHIKNLHWITEVPQNKLLTDISIRLRSTHRPALGNVSMEENACATIRFQEAQRAITPGQFAVLYKDDQVLGSGIIQA